MIKPRAALAAVLSVERQCCNGFIEGDRAVNLTSFCTSTGHEVRAIYALAPQARKAAPTPRPGFQAPC